MKHIMPVVKLNFDDKC